LPEPCERRVFRHQLQLFQISLRVNLQGQFHQTGNRHRDLTVWAVQSCKFRIASDKRLRPDKVVLVFQLFRFLVRKNSEPGLSRHDLKTHRAIKENIDRLVIVDRRNNDSPIQAPKYLLLQSCGFRRRTINPGMGDLARFGDRAAKHERRIFLAFAKQPGPVDAVDDRERTGPQKRGPVLRQGRGRLRPGGLPRLGLCGVWWCHLHLSRTRVRPAEQKRRE
jgi:hypothetical protein